MSKLRWGICFAALAVAALSSAGSPALAQPPPPGYAGPLPPSPFETGIRAFGMGAAVGTAVGYLVAREDGFSERDWRPIVAGMGIGALAGGTLGLTLGLVENNSPQSAGRGYLVMRGMTYGAEFGFLAGCITGGLAALETDHVEHVLFGGAIGTLIGASVGLLVGSLERNPWATPPAAPPFPRPMAFIAPTFAAYRTLGGSLALAPAVAGRF